MTSMNDGSSRIFSKSGSLTAWKRTVGSAAIALARSAGLSPVIGTAGSPEKCAVVRDLGADDCLDYRTTDVAAAIEERTEGRGVDYVLESVGGAVYAENRPDGTGLRVVLSFPTT